MCTCYLGYRFNQARHRRGDSPYCLGQYTCCLAPTQKVFPSGETSHSSPLTPADINECEQPGTSMCHQECVNTVGSFLCRCRRGYILAPDRRSCVPVHNCEMLTSSLETFVYVHFDVCMLSVVLRGQARLKLCCSSEVHGDVRPIDERWYLLVHLSGL